MNSHSIPEHNQGDLKKNSVNHLLRQLFHAHFLAFNEKFNEIESLEGMGMGHQRIIMHLLHNEGASQSDIAKKSNIARATVNKTIVKMEEKGLIIKKIDESNKRGSKLFLTNSGRELKKPIQEMFNEIQNVVLAGFSIEDQEKLKEFLINMITNLNDHRSKSSTDNNNMKMKKKVKIENND